jgi:SAM-dependent methyltransferase
MAISEKEVIWGYQMIFGREPESVDALHANMNSADLHTLQNRFLASTEFLLKRKNYAAAYRQDVQEDDFAPTAGAIEYEATLNQLVECTAKVLNDSEFVRAVRPHYALRPLVDLDETDIDKNVEDYWATGLPEAQALVDTLNKHHFVDTKIKTVVEFGCEVGRRSFALSQCFQKVIGYDSSAGLVRLAKNKASELLLVNCTFHESARNPFSVFEPCDLFYSKDALQSLPPPLILQTIRNALRSLKPGGLALFELPTSLADYSFSIKKWLQTDKSSELTIHCLPQQPVFAAIQENACEILEVSEQKDTDRKLITNRFMVRKISTAKAKKLVLPVFLS